MASLGATAFSYDANGNLLADYARTYQWDGENRLVGIAGTVNGAPYTTSIAYDGFGRRIAMATSTGGVSGAAHYGWCGQTLCQQRSAADTPTRRYLAEGEYDATPGGQGALLYATDQLGSVRDVLSATGARLNHFDYDPYGNATAATGASHASWTDFRYAGLVFHPTSGLYLATHRAYDPAIGRWLSRDPIAEQGGINLYGYVGGNPISRFDPHELCYLYDVQQAVARIPPKSRACATRQRNVPPRQSAAMRPLSSRPGVRHTSRMPEDRCNRMPEGTFFFAVNLLDPSSRLLLDEIDLLRHAVPSLRARAPFRIDAWVMLPHHMQSVWALPAAGADISQRWRPVKACFAAAIPSGERRSATRVRNGERGLWQRLFREHTIRDDRDYANHLDYMHCNPVKRGWVAHVADRPFSSFHRCVARGLYPADWGGIGAGAVERGERR